MAHKKFGKIHFCNHCNTKFFDFGKEVSACPKCGNQVNIGFVLPAEESKGKAKKREVHPEFEEDLESIEDFDSGYDDEIDTDFGDDFGDSGGGSSGGKSSDFDDDEDEAEEEI